MVGLYNNELLGYKSYFLLIHTFNYRSNLTICTKFLDATLECKGSRSTRELMLFIAQPYWLSYNHLASLPPSNSKMLSACIQVKWLWKTMCHTIAS